MVPEMKERIFDLFFRIEEKKDIGSGIGLALVKELAQLHQGDINVESKPGEGSCFSVLLPVSLLPYQNGKGCEFDSNTNSPTAFIVDEAHTNPIEEPSSGTDENAEAPIVLIVEDNDDIRTYIKDSLSKEYQIIVACDGEEGWEKIVEAIPDLVVSDVMMPKMSGFELCEKIKEDERTSHIPVILLTAKQSDEARLEGYETGADDYIVKPFNSALLRIRIHNLIESRKKLRSLFGNVTRMELKKISVNPTDERFINRAVDCVQAHLADNHFTPDIFANEMAVSRSQLFRKIKAMTNQTVQEFIMTLRLNKAAELLLTGEYTIGEIALLCGFSDPSNFTRSFTKKFGATPSHYIKKNS